MLLGLAQWVFCFYLLNKWHIKRSFFEWLYIFPWISTTAYLFQYDGIFSSLLFAYFGTILYVCATSDWHYLILPDEGAWLLFLGAVGLHLESGSEEILSYVISSVCLASFLYFLRWISRGGVGLGDVKYAFVLGLWVSPTLSAIMMGLAFVLGAIYAVIVKASYKGESLLPFGPFLCLSGGLCYLWGEFMKEGIYTLNYW